MDDGCVDNIIIVSRRQDEQRGFFKKQRENKRQGLDIPTWHKYNNSCSSRSWRNRQTRTFEGRMGDRMGSSPIDRTSFRASARSLALLFLCGSKASPWLLLGNDYAAIIGGKAFKHTIGPYRYVLHFLQGPYNDAGNACIRIPLCLKRHTRWVIQGLGLHFRNR